LPPASNVLGTSSPVAEIVERAQAAGARVLLDGAQAAPHLPVDVAALGADFYAFSGHKLGAPTGIGVLYGRREVLEPLEPFFGGSEIIREVVGPPPARQRSDVRRRPRRACHPPR